ncbi:MAG: AraC family transcriptional regulator [Candidatus Eremiobacteraeota bacterium]|nr:AraC family transcriptional regulator [Candidatus Eremiobacteraeota bacterium]MDQ2864798.1 AraC family transcriptional regulator [Candidatus Eremiobacteraeota bacterium]
MQDKEFEFNCLVVTTAGHWEFSGIAGKEDVDSARLTVGVIGDRYGCRHFRDGEDRNLIVALRAGAIDPDQPPLFKKQLIPARNALCLAQRAANAGTDDSFDSLIFSIFDAASAASTKRSEFRPAKPRMQRAKRFLETHAFERISLANVAAELGLSPFSTVRQFRAATGMTPYGYILQLRLKKAKELLSTTNDGIAEIADKIGFADPAYFSRWFSKSTTYAPSVYRTISG